MNATESVVAEYLAQEILRNSADKIDLTQLILEDGILDSFGLQQLVTFIEQEFAVDVADELILPENFESIRAIAALVDSIRK